MSLVAYDSSGSEDSDKEESSTQKTQRKLLPVLSTPTGMRKRQSGPVKICLPTLDREALAESDEEEEDCAPATKRKFGGSGLTALLPQPRLSRKLISKATPTDTPSSQDMVPYALSRHGRAAMAARRDLMKKTRKSKAAEKERNEDDSDSDDSEPVSFFSHLDTPSVAEHPAGGDEGVVSVLGREGEESVQAAPSAPKPFNIETMGVDQSTVDPSLVTRLWEESVGTSDDSLNVEGEREQPHLLSAYPSHMPGAGPGLSMDDQAYRRLTGSRRKRGRDPALNDLIEINEDDVKVGMETYRKNLSEESIEKMYKPPDGSKPTSQQKKKHQLSFLAHHAKENELKLLKQWAQSAATRRDTQMKYGF